MSRADGRANDELRPVKMTRKFISTAEGSVLIEVGGTRVICTASIEDKVPQFMKDSGKGWITAEYAMLPRSTNTRKTRESSIGKVGGRTHEIQRLIGRSLRSIVDLEALGERTIWIDCDVIEADGGTRTASITGAYVALVEALKYAMGLGMISTLPIRDHVAAVSVGVIDGVPMLDLCYTEDSRADVDMNVVLTGDGRIIELQGTAEGPPFSRETMDELVKLGFKGVGELIAVQKAELSGAVVK